MTYKNAQQWVCKYCNSIIVSRKCLFAHYKECKEKDKLPKDSLGRSIIPDQQRGLLAHSKSLKGTHPIGRPHTDEAKKKISEERLKALAEGRGNHLICPNIKRSYAEQYFYDSFVNANVKFENNVWLCKRYCVDFLFGKYYFEVDGEQHFTEDAKKHDADRDEQASQQQQGLEAEALHQAGGDGAAEAGGEVDDGAKQADAGAAHAEGFGHGAIEHAHAVGADAQRGAGEAAAGDDHQPMVDAAIGCRHRNILAFKR